MCVCVSARVCVCVCVCVYVFVCLTVLVQCTVYSLPNNLAQVIFGSLVKIVWCSVMHAEIQMKMVPKCTERITISRHIMKPMIKINIHTSNNTNFKMWDIFFWLTLYIYIYICISRIIENIKYGFIYTKGLRTPYDQHPHIVSLPLQIKWTHPKTIYFFRSHDKIISKKHGQNTEPARDTACANRYLNYENWCNAHNLWSGRYVKQETSYFLFLPLFGFLVGLSSSTYQCLSNINTLSYSFLEYASSNIIWSLS